MTNRVRNALYGFLTAICMLLFTNIIIMLVKDSWELFGIPDIVLMIALFVLFPFYGKMCNHMGKLDERNRQRSRITNLMETYQTEPHGIRYSQKSK